MEVQNAQHGYNIGIGKIQALKISLEVKTGILNYMFLKGGGYLSTTLRHVNPLQKYINAGRGGYVNPLQIFMNAYML